MRKMIHLLCAALFIHLGLPAQSPFYGFDEIASTSGIFQAEGRATDNPQTEKQPAFKGGMEALLLYLEDELIYPERARNESLEGQVMIQFVVDENGLAENPKIIQSLGFGCDEEAIRLIHNMPEWQPAKKDNIAVKAQVVLPIYFTQF